MLVVTLVLGLSALVLVLTVLLSRSKALSYLVNPRLDERQHILLGVGMKLGLLVVFGQSLLYTVAGNWIFPVVSAQFVVASYFWLPVGVVGAYNIWQGAIFSVGTPKKNYHLQFGLLFLLNCGMIALSLSHAQETGQLGLAIFGPKGIGGMLCLQAAGLAQVFAYVLRQLIGQKEEEEDDDVVA